MTRVIQRSALLLAAGLMASAPVYAQTQSEEVGSAPAATFGAPDLTAPIWTRGVMGTVLFDNGPLVNSPGTGSGGTDESILQTSLNMDLLGFGHQLLNGNRMADDFTIPPGETWIIDEFVFFAYQTGSTTTSTMTGVNMRIWDGDPSLPGSTVVFGDTSTNVMTDTAFTNIFRVTEATTGTATNRPIMAQTADTAGLVLPAGTYWVDWQTDGSLASGPWAPPITINGTPITGNALQSLADNGATWAPAIDDGPANDQNFPQGLPFLVVGALQVIIPETQPVPTLGTAGLVTLVLMLALFAATVLRRRA